VKTLLLLVALATPAAALPRPGVLVVLARPWARVVVDGVDTGRVTPVVRMPLAAGRHDIVLVAPDGRVRRYAITLHGGETVSLVARFAAD
jgi:PEGA domain